MTALPGEGTVSSRPVRPSGALREAIEGHRGELCFVPASEFRKLQELSVSPHRRVAIFAGLCRLNVLYMIARAGSGHIGTCFSSIDLMSWLYLQELERVGERDGDLFFSSKGHDAPALYAVLMGVGLLDFDLIHRLRRLGGLPGHPQVETPHIHTNSGSLGMGISKAKGMAEADRLLGRRRRIYVLTGDGELQEGQIWESLGTAAHRGLTAITAIVDHNKVQSDTWVDEVSPLGDLEAKFAAFGWHVDRCDGHDFAAIDAALARLGQVTDRPKALIADTVKGKGVSFMEALAMKPGQLYRYHSGAPSAEEYERGVEEILAVLEEQLGAVGFGDLLLEWLPRPAREKHTSYGNIHRLVAAYEDELMRQAERNPRIVVLDADLVKDCGLVSFQRRFPERFIECGIAEQDMVSQAGGLARMGMIPVAHSFACFLSVRPNEQIYNNATEGSKVIYVGSLAGLLPGGPGHSHQSVRDISALAAVPGLVLIEPCCEEEVRQALDFAINRTERSTYIRLVSMGWDMPFRLPPDYRLRLGRGVTVREGADAVVFAYGPWLLSNAYEAAELLAAERGWQIRVVNLPWLNRVEDDWLAEAVSGCRWVFALDNHYEDGGQGQMLACRLAELGLGPAGVHRIGVDRVPDCGGTGEVLAAHGLDPRGLAARIAAGVGGAAEIGGAA